MIAVLTASLLVAASAQATAPADVLAVRASQVLTGEGPAIQDGVILIRDGKIVAVGKDVRVPEGARVIAHEGVASAGMVALHGRPGLEAPSARENVQVLFFGPEGHPLGAHPHEGGTHVHEDDLPAVEAPPPDVPGPMAMDEAAPAAASSYTARDSWGDTTRTMLPDGRMLYAFDPSHSAFRALAAAGVTSIVLTPAPQGLIAGQSAVVKTDGGRVLRPAAQLSLGFRGDALAENVYPTSHSGAIAELEQRFAEPKGAFAAAKAGKLGVLFETSSRQDVVRAAAFARAHGLKGAVSGADLAGEVVDALRASGLGVVLGPFDPGLPPRTLHAIAALAKAGVPFGFGLDAPRESPAGLRFAAASCIAAGVERDVAWGALTGTAAKLAGVADHVGKLAPGYDADVVLWSGHPLDLASRVEGVLVDGRLVESGVEGAR